MNKEREDIAGEMTFGSRKSATKARGRPFEPGNSGKPKGTRHKVTMAVETFLRGRPSV
jgi:hypothetical protein